MEWWGARLTARGLSATWAGSVGSAGSTGPPSLRGWERPRWSPRSDKTAPTKSCPPAHARSAAVLRASLGLAVRRSALPGPTDRRGGCNSSRAGEAQSSPPSAEFGGRGLEFGEPTDGSRRRRADGAAARVIRIARIHLTYAPYIRSSLQRTLHNKINHTIINCIIAQYR